MTELWDGTGVTSAALKAEVIRLAEENPDQEAQCIYTRSYWTDDEVPVEVFTKPECIVGTAVYNITGKLVGPEYEGTAVGGGQWREALAYEESGDSLFVLRVQRLQDDGFTWGAALRGAMSNN